MTTELYKLWSTENFMLQIWKNVQLKEIYPWWNKLLELLIYKYIRWKYCFFLSPLSSHLFKYSVQIFCSKNSVSVTEKHTSLIVCTPLLQENCRKWAWSPNLKKKKKKLVLLINGICFHIINLTLRLYHFPALVIHFWEFMRSFLALKILLAILSW